MMLFLLVLVSALGTGFSYTHHVLLSNENKIHLSWKLEDEVFTFKVEAETHGYFGIGFGTSGSMAGADMVIGWINEGKTHLKDYHGIGNTSPVLDKSQDYHVISGYENETHTVMEFYRKADTGDCDHDMILGDDTIRVLYASHPEDPVNDGKPEYHSTRRGVKSVYMRDPHMVNDDVDYDTTWTITAGNVHLMKNLSTYYMCRVYNFQSSTTQYMVGYRPIIQERHESLVHHIIIYRCHDDDLDATFAHHASEGTSTVCLSPNMPKDFRKCRSVIVAWAVGSEGETYPEDVALPLYKGDYFLAEIHYDRPDLQKDSTDNSGIKFLLNNSPPKHLAGTLRIGLEVSKFQVIPPGQKTWLNVGLCPAKCTEKGLNSTIHFFQVLLHGHLAMKQAFLRHVRDGKELPRIATDRHYDFNYQQARVLKKHVEVEPGDSFLMECVYDTSERDRFTLGGLSTVAEMCLAYVMYYPLQGLEECVSKPDKQAKCAFIEDHASPEVNMHHLPPAYDSGALYDDYCGDRNAYNGKLARMNVNQNTIDALQALERTDRQKKDCVYRGKKMAFAEDEKYTNYPNFEELEDKEDTCQSDASKTYKSDSLALTVLWCMLSMYCMKML